MTRNARFFSGPQGAAEMKHGVLKRYLPGFAGSTGSTSVDNKVVYIDAFAGPGAYNDGTPGSPAIVLEIAKVMSPTRMIEGYCIEANARYFKELKERLDKVEGWHAIRGQASEVIASVLTSVNTAPCFVFLDPFGIKDLPFDLVETVLSRAATTEALVRFDNSGVWRTGGHVASARGSPSSIGALNAFCGGDWWQPMWQPGQGRDFSDAVLQQYAERVATATRCGYLYFEVADRPGDPADYHLVHFASHPLAFWKMNESLSLWRQSSGPEETLFDQPDHWVVELRDNIRALLDDGPFRVWDKLGPVFGTTLGKARTTHVRQALRDLENAGLIAGPVKGDISRFRVSKAE